MDVGGPIVRCRASLNEGAADDAHALYLGRSGAHPRIVVGASRRRVESGVAGESVSPSSLDSGEQLALVRLPARMRRALRLFRRLTGHTAVASLATSLPEPEAPVALSPPVHPRCARELRSLRNAPCGEQWSIHLSTLRRSSKMHVHTCPIGLLCSCVPIHFGGRLVGVAKVVGDGGKPDAAFQASLGVLNLVVSEACKDSAVNVLSEEVSLLRRRVTELQGLHATDRRHARPPRTLDSSPDEETAGAALVSLALAHLHGHFRDPSLSLQTVARALAYNPKYLTSRFSDVVGEHMHTYLVTLRVSHACGLLVQTHLRVKEIAHASGFPQSARMASAFRTHIGVSPREYRRIFAGS
jgi:AraC-like DNA-binding protein